MTSTKSVLFSSVCQPFGIQQGDGFSVTYNGSKQLLWAQGVFRTHETSLQWSIDFIAENIEAPAVTLHYPTLKDFVREIKKGYDYVGISFNVPVMHKVVPMVEAVRRFAPSSRIVLGGYGTVLGDKELKHYGDHICRGEGVSFMRDLLGEANGTPLTPPLITQRTSLFSLPLPGRQGIIIAGLGCPNACDFCATSHYFKHRHIPLLPSGEAILDAIRRYRERYPRMVSFYINDEDFLLNRERGRQFLEAVRASDLPPLELQIFGSVKGLSQFSAAELVEMGVEMVWVGFEGLRAGYRKMEGRPYGELLADLRRHGINVLASMIIGFDYQDEKTIEEEFRKLIAMRPALCQFLIYGPTFGTAAHERMRAEGRLFSEMWEAPGWRKLDGYVLTFDHPHIKPERMSQILMSLYRREYELLGPSIFRAVDTWLEGGRNLKDHPSPRVRSKAQTYRRNAHRALTLIPGSLGYVNGEARKGLEDLRRNLVSETGGMAPGAWFLSKILPLFMKMTDLRYRYGLFEKPSFVRKTFRMAGR